MPQPSPASESPQPAPTRLQSLLGAPRAAIAWIAASRRRLLLLLTGAAVLSAIVVVAGVLTSGRRQPVVEEAVNLDMALEALDHGDHARARQLAEKLQQQGAIAAEDWWGPPYVLGVVAAAEAERSWARDKTRAYLVAARYLEAARDRGFPPEREAEGAYLLGKCLCLSGRTDAARAALQYALKINPQRQQEIRNMLVGVYLKGTAPDLDKALRESTQYLADPDLSAEARDEGLLQQAEILSRQNRLAESVAVLDKIPAAAPIRGEAVLLQGQILRRQAQALKAASPAGAESQRAARQKFEAAIVAFRRATSYDTVDNRITPQALYLITKCLAESGDDRKATEELARIGKLFPDTPTALAAALDEAETARRAGQRKQALAAYLRVLRAVSDPADFRNPWITLADLRSRVLAAVRHYQEARNFDVALQLARRLYPLLSQVQALQWTAQVHRAWGNDLLEQADRLPSGKADVPRHLGRAQLRQAGTAFARLAALEIASREYPDHLWNSATAYLQGQDYRNAARVLEKCAKEGSRRLRPLVLVALGEARLALNRLDEALEACQECMDFHPRDPAAYRARLVASHACREKGELKQAEALLLENLQGEHLTPASKEWRQSLFALGELLNGQRRYAEAVRRLDEAVERYADAPQALEARYLLADSARRAADALRRQAAKEPSGAARAAAAAQARELLEKAQAEYRRIETLLARRDERDLPPREKALLRNAAFGIGETAFELGQYGEAAQAYAAAINRWPNSPETLDAYVRLADAYRRLDQPSEARGTIQQARIVLSRMKDDGRLSQTTNYDRKQWSEVLDWMSNL